jgi:hypothetical protein
MTCILLLSYGEVSGGGQTSYFTKAKIHRRVNKRIIKMIMMIMSLGFMFFI